MRTGFRLAGACLCSAALQFGAHAAVGLFPGNPGDVFYSVGVDSGGKAIIAGRRGASEGFFELKSGELKFTELQAVRTSMEQGVWVSRDGKYLVSEPETDAPLLWERAGLTSQSLTDITPWSYHISCLTTLGGEPVVAGSFYDGFTVTPTLWSPSEGLKDLSEDWGLGTNIEGLAKDGRMVASGIRFGEPVLLAGADGFAAAMLQADGNDNVDVAAFSPNGKHIAAVFARTIFSQAVLWTELKPQLLAQPDDEPARAVRAVSDSGYIGGQGRSLTGTNPRDESAFIMDPNTGRAQWFDEWWAAQPSAPPLPAAVSWVNDLCEADGSIYCLIEEKEGRPLLAIASASGQNAPVLAISPSAKGAILRWPAKAGSVIETAVVPSGGWETLAVAPTTSGADYVVEVPAADRTRFFRVRNP